VKTMCRVLTVSESGYYAWRKREPSHRQRQNERLTEHIRQAYKLGRQVYGSPRVHAELRAQGIMSGKHHVARLMRQANLCAIQKRRRICTTDSHHSDPVAPNLLQRDFTAPAPNRKWLTDITAVWTAEGWLYLAVVLDVYSRLVVGWAMASHRDESLVEEARLPGTGLAETCGRVDASFRSRQSVYQFILSSSAGSVSYPSEHERQRRRLTRTR
jgi:putative transposase